MSKDPKVLHVAKWYPHASDPQNGIFVQKHIEATSDAPLILGFVNSNDKLEEQGGIQIYGARRMSQVAKFGAFTARIALDRPDIVHFHCYAPDLLPLLWYARLKGIKTIHTEHGSAFLKNRLPLLQGWAWGSCWKHSKMISCAFVSNTTSATTQKLKLDGEEVRCLAAVEMMFGRMLMF